MICFSKQHWTLSLRCRDRPSFPVAVLAHYEGRRAITNKRRASVTSIQQPPRSPQLPLHVVTAGPEDDASGAAGFQLDETFAQLLASACEGHPFRGGYVDERVMAVRNVEGMTAVNGEVADVFVRTFDASQPRFAVRRAFTLSEPARKTGNARPRSHTHRHHHKSGIWY